MRVLTIANQKGGIAKTTTTTSIAAGLHRAGRKVLLIDLDTQGDLSYNVGVVEPRRSLAQVINGTADINEVIQHTESGLDETATAAQDYLALVNEIMQEV